MITLINAVVGESECIIDFDISYSLFSLKFFRDGTPLSQFISQALLYVYGMDHIHCLYSNNIYAVVGESEWIFLLCFMNDQQ